MKILNIYGDNRLETYTKTREACRGIVVSDEKILLAYEVNTDQWFIPGGMVEFNESLDACCTRELIEETGYLVKTLNQYLTINEYYEEWFLINHYYVCELTRETGERRLSKREILAGLQPRWLPLKEAIEIFSKHQDYADINEMKRGAYLREYKALSNFIEIR